MSASLPDRRSVALAGLATGAALCLGSWRARRWRVADEIAAEVWVLDRGARQLVGLCARLLPVVRLPITPREPGESGRLLVSAGGAVWVAGEERVQAVRADGAVSLDVAAREVRDLAPLTTGEAEDVVLLEHGGALRRIDALGRSRGLVEVAGAQRIASRGERVLVAALVPGRRPQAWLALLDAGPRPDILALRRLRGRPLELAPAADEGWWLLEAPYEAGGGARRLTLLGRAVEEVWSRSVPSGATWLVPGPGGVWLEDLERQGLLRLGPQADPTGWMELPPALRRPRAVVALGEGLLLATPGSLVALAPDGRLAGSQGGFDDLTQLALSGQAGARR